MTFGRQNYDTLTLESLFVTLIDTLLSAVSVLYYFLSFDWLDDPEFNRIKCEFEQINRQFVFSLSRIFQSSKNFSQLCSFFIRQLRKQICERKRKNMQKSN